MEENNRCDKEKSKVIMEYGIVYLLTNPVMHGLVKIGMTTQEDIEGYDGRSCSL